MKVTTRHRDYRGDGRPVVVDTSKRALGEAEGVAKVLAFLGWNRTRFLDELEKRTGKRPSPRSLEGYLSRSGKRRFPVAHLIVLQDALREWRRKNKHTASSLEWSQRTR